MSAQSPIDITVNGLVVRCAAGVTVAAALLNAGVAIFRRSLAGEPRGPLCGMGTCQECRATINGRAHVRACMTQVEDGMTVITTDHDG